MRACRPPAREPTRSWLARRSTMATSTPASASSPASISPVGPPPAITTACSVIATARSGRGRRRRAPGSSVEGGTPYAGTAAARSRIGAPEPPYRSATISARIASAVSAGARPPRSSPTGPRSRASSASLTPGLEQARPPIGLGLARPDRADVAAAATERLDDGRLVELDVVREDGDRVVRAEPDLVGDLVGPADDEPVDLGEALRRRERGPAVDDDGLEAELAREPDERPGDLDAADDDQPRPDREDLDEQRPAAELDGPRQARARRAAPASATSCGVQLRRAERAGQPPVVADDQLGGRRRPVARLVRAELARWRVGGERRDRRPSRGRRTRPIRGPPR